MAVYSEGESFSVPNRLEDLEALSVRLAQFMPKVVVLEATGGYERAVVAALLVANRPVVVALYSE